VSATKSEDSVTIGGEYWSAQLKVFDALESDEFDLVVFRTGYGGGKSLLGSDWIIGVATSVEKSDNLVIAPDAQKGAPTTYKVFFERLPGEDTVPDEGGDPENSPIVEKYHARDKRVTLVNGSIIRLGSADVWNRYAGGEFNAIWCDEVAHYEHTDLYDLHEMLVTRQRTAAGPNVTLWTSTGNGFNQFYDVTEREIEPYEGEERPLPWADAMEVIVGSSLGNPFLHEKEKMKRSFEDTERAKQALHGGFAAPKGLVYGDFTRNVHVVPEDDVDDLVAGTWRMYGYDHGWKDPRVIPEIGKTSHSQFIVKDLFYRSGVKYQVAVDWLVENDKPRGTVYAEHEPEHQEAFRKAGYPCEPAIKDLDEGIPRVREFLETDEQGRPGLLVSDHCVELIQEFQSYKEEHVGKSGAKDHALDALRYAIMGDTYLDEDGARSYYDPAENSTITPHQPEDL